MTKKHAAKPVFGGLVPFSLSEVEQLQITLHVALDAVPSKVQLAEKGDIAHAIDRERLRQRQLLKAALNFVRENLLRDVHVEDGSINWDMSDEPRRVAFEELRTAIGHFADDVKRLDRGLKADTVLAPVQVDGDGKGEDLVDPQTNVLLWALLYLDFNPYLEFTPPRKAAQLHFADAADYSGYAASSLRTLRKNLRASIKAYSKGPSTKRQVFSEAACHAFAEREQWANDWAKSIGRHAVWEFIGKGIKGLARELGAVKPLRGKKG